MNAQDRKYFEAKAQIQASLQNIQTPKIPGLNLKSGTGTALTTPVPANLPVPTAQPKNPAGMSAEAVAFLCLLTYPARLNLWQTSVLLGVNEDGIRKLIKAEVLNPLNIREGTEIYFAHIYIVAVSQSLEKLSEITQTLNQIWADRNAEVKAAKKEEAEEKEASVEDEVAISKQTKRGSRRTAGESDVPRSAGIV